jgi:hypothetical protein
MLSVKLNLKEVVMNKKVSIESAIKDISHRTRRKYSSDEKISIFLEGLRGEAPQKK